VKQLQQPSIDAFFHPRGMKMEWNSCILKLRLML
jgi:hypothetical protein